MERSVFSLNNHHHLIYRHNPNEMSLNVSPNRPSPTVTACSQRSQGLLLVTVLHFHHLMVDFFVRCSDEHLSCQRCADRHLECQYPTGHECLSPDDHRSGLLNYVWSR
ncbi:hypothetical protein GYMLUDRAFT_697578 [Collybiopsis luxurians FD-317 M1]|uniref:Unplaced genomic scaffold GYMLUscaffold_38, whole genome shotgun sequence n=1 Tax=Collybiopsis luxurians FD-317 M1 TaxID=944289 RepID=A0A0D0CRD9_9AGAR|nr:hypothetical protein GYMLUDRAFT_697578 [Collybiopsis luxurians FD-317 M1]